MSEDMERSDAQIDDLLAGRGASATDPTVLWLASGETCADDQVLDLTVAHAAKVLALLNKCQ